MSASVALAIRDVVRARRALPPPQMRRALRVAAGLSTSDLAGAMAAAGLPVSRQAVSAWELGRRTPRGPYLAAYLDVLDELRQVA